MFAPRRRTEIPAWKILLFALMAVGVFIHAQPSNGDTDSFVRIMKNVADYQLAHPKHKDTDWHNGALYAGIMALYDTTRGKKYLEALMAMGERNQWRLGPRTRNPDDQCIGQTYLELYFVKKDPQMIAAIRRTFDGMIKAPERDRTEWFWCDALFMSPPVLARLAVATGDLRYLNFMNDMWWDATDHLYDRKDFLYFRDQRFFQEKEKNGKKVFWGRGNAWVMAGLCRILQYMPQTFAEKERYISLFRDISNKVVSLQGKDGFWRSSLLDPDSYPGGESSATGLFCYAIAWGINNGLLPRGKYLPIAERAWTALVGSVEDSGKLGWVQPPGDRPMRVERNDTEVYGVGAFLLAGSEMLKLFSTDQLPLSAAR